MTPYTKRGLIHVQHRERVGRGNTKRIRKKRHKEALAGRADAGNHQGVFEGVDFKLYADVYGHAKHGLCVHTENLAAAVLCVRI